MAQNAYLFLKIDGSDVDTQVHAAGQEDSFDFSGGRTEAEYEHEFEPVYFTSYSISGSSQTGAEEHYYTIQLTNATVSNSTTDDFDLGV